MKKTVRADRRFNVRIFCADLRTNASKNDIFHIWSISHEIMELSQVHHHVHVYFMKLRIYEGVDLYWEHSVKIKRFISALGLSKEIQPIFNQGFYLMENRQL